MVRPPLDQLRHPEVGNRRELLLDAPDVSILVMKEIESAAGNDAESQQDKHDKEPRSSARGGQLAFFHDLRGSANAIGNLIKRGGVLAGS